MTMSAAAFAAALSLSAPSLPSNVAAHAAAAYTCAAGSVSRRLLIADMSKPNSAERLWVFDTSDANHPRLLLKPARVAHGIGSDPERRGSADRFGNREGSYMTSLGAYRIAEKFVSVTERPGYALDGLDASNDRARERHVVMHPAGYVPATGPVGYSEGCTAVAPDVFNRLDGSKIGGGLLWIDGPSRELANARSLHCAAVAEEEAWAAVNPWAPAGEACPTRSEDALDSGQRLASK